MKRNKINKSGICRAAALLLVLSALLPAGALRAQVKINHGVDMSATTGLFAPNNFIYFGDYDHATKLEYKFQGVPYENRGPVKTYAGARQPILWRVMGEENGYGKITLMSEYVLDSRPYGNGTEVWNNSGIYNWLNGDFATIANFALCEQGVVCDTTTVNARAYDHTTLNIVVSTSTALSTKFYLPWGTPNRIDEGATPAPAILNYINKEYWNADGSIDAAYEMSAAVRGAGLKGSPNYNVYYWLSPSLHDLPDQKLLVKSDGDLNIEGIGVSMGVRPIFKLDTIDILFASELMEPAYITQVDQMVADNGNTYRSEEAIPNGDSGGKAFKLTLKTAVPSFNTNELYYDLDEILLATTDTVGFKPGETVSFGTTGVNAAADRVAYKIVSADNNLKHYGKENATTSPGTIDLIANDIYTQYVGTGVLPNTPWYRSLNSGTFHTAYVWAQKDNDIRSHEGSEPIPFTIKVLTDNTAPLLEPILAKRYLNTSADVTFRITEANRDVKYYYVVDPGTPLTSFSDFEPLVRTFVANKTKIKLSAAAEQITINLPTFGDNNPHAIYIVAKDLVRNISNVLAMTIPIYVPNSPIAVKNPVPELIMEEGDSITIAPGFVVTDADTDDHLTFVPLSVASSDPSIAEATVISGSITVNDSVKVKGVASEITFITVQVTDNSWRPEKPDTTVVITIPVTVTERMPDAVIDYIEEQLTGLSDGWYGFNGEPAVEITDGVYPIADDWFDTDLDIVRVHPGNAVLNSPTQTLTIPARPDAPVLSVVDESYSGWNDGQINSVSSEMEYKADTMAIWTPVAAGYNTVFGLAPGKYQVRYKAAIDRFVSWVSVVTIRMGAPWTAFQRMVSLPDVSGVTSTPSPGIHYTASSTSFAFSLKFGGAPRSVTTSRVVEGVPEVLTGVANAAGGYDYVILRLQQPVAVYIGDAIQANASIEAERTIWSHAGRIYVEASRDDTAAIYALTGQLLKQVDVQEGTTGITIGRGVYVVVLKNGAKQKVIVH